jgi:hypothetical protein
MVKGSGVNAVLILAALGGGVSFLSAIVIIARAIFKQVNATEDNTEATKALSKQMETVVHQMNGHETRISMLEDRERRPR